ncbi:MAG: hypothetical protein A3E61_01080 [Candidatus Colwellbacteria bacterium RIFCSPHIGHO2_12_FULL_43_12]|uniref:Methionyl-tRNA formyltransferase n=1 Tax=Candidatus Colwellbacteria bacterium RIFCSPHIGHO2_12_FULL_43_12 TaxID=1797688 RepID=A0A1G1Z389_9BACT|nr:MAG: hypothetical protein A3E61_01080 [Candidatus Colwellbacteria bacterium RIFCSPHIGHO2_12_FULL_43_12]
MKYIFFGTPKFAATILDKVVDAGMPPLAIVCNPDKPMGRRMVITPPPAKEVILRRQLLGVDVLQPEKIDEAFFSRLKSYEADFFVVAAYGKILPLEVLNLPKLGTIGVHPSLLPKLRGASPIQSAILEGVGLTGVTLFLLDEKVDHGSILSYSVYNMQSSHTYEDLEEILARHAGNLLVKTMPGFSKGEIKPEIQNELEVTFTKKFTTEDGYVSVDNLKKALEGSNPELASLIDRKIKALNPEPGVYTMIENKRTKLLSSAMDKTRLVLKDIQFEGKKPMPFFQYQKPLS